MKLVIKGDLTVNSQESLSKSLSAKAQESLSNAFSAKAVDIVDNSSSLPFLLLHRKAEESEVDSPFSRSSSLTEQHDIHMADKRKAKRCSVTANITGFDVANAKSARNKKARGEKIIEGRLRSIEIDHISPDLSLEPKSDDSEQDSPFSKCSAKEKRLTTGKGINFSTAIAHRGKKSSVTSSKIGATNDPAAKLNEPVWEDKLKQKTLTSGEKPSSLSSADSAMASKNHKYKNDDCESAASPLTVLSDKEAWARLKTEKYGFAERGNIFYCLPDVDPSKNNFREGHDYFKDLKSLRKNLCAFGLPDPDRKILEDEDLSNWICLSISSLVDGQVTVPPYEPFLNFTKAWGVLTKIGFKYAGGMYYFPNKERSFPNAFDIWCHLSRFGIPQTASFQKIDEKTLLSLELFLTDYPSEKRQLWCVFCI